MAEITQKLGFDVSQGVSALRELSTAVESLNISLRNLNNANLGNVSKQLDSIRGNLSGASTAGSAATKTIRGFAQGTSTAGGSIAAANQQLGVLNGNFQVAQTGADGATKSIRGMIGAFATLGVARQGLSAIKDLLFEAADASREFQQSIAEVQTIAGGTTFSTLTNEIRALSVEFGKPTVEQAEAAYQAFSNQVVQTSADMGFLNDANKLAIATVSSTADSVNVLSSVINSYGLAASDAARISDVLFKTVEEGRLRLSEIANSLGTVTPLAKEAGVSFEEVSGALATITRRGTTASVAMTQVRGILQKVLKPTEEMNKAFASFGATDGPSAIKAAGGFNEFLVKMTQFAEKNGTTVQKMFGRVRAGVGVLNLAADGGEVFADVLKELEDSANATQEAFDKINATDARQAEIAFNELKVTVEQLGDAVVPVITKFVQGINTIIPDAQTLGIALAAVAASLSLVAVSATAALAALLPVGAISGILLPVAPLIAAIGAAALTTALALRSVNAEFETLKNARIKDLQTAQKAAEDQVKIEQEKAEIIKQAIKDVTKQITAEYGKQVAAAKAANTQSIQSFNSVIEAFGDSRKAVIKDLKDSIKNAEGEIAASAGRLKSITQEIADIDFAKSTERLSGQAKVQALLNRALKTGRDAREEFAAAGLDTEKQRAALDSRATTRRQLDAAAAAAAATETQVDDRQVAEAKRRFLKQIAADEKKNITEKKKFLDEEKGKIKEAIKALQDQTKEVGNLKGEYINLLSAVDEFGNLKGPAQLKADFQDAKKVLEEIIALAKSDPTGGLADKVGAGDELRSGGDQAVTAAVDFAAQQAQIRTSLQNVLNSAPFQAKVQFEQALEQQEAKISTAEAEAKLASLSTALAKQLTEVASALTRETGLFGLQDAFTGAADKAADYEAKLAGVARQSLETDSAQRKLRDSIAGALKNTDLLTEDGVANAKTQLDAALNVAEGQLKSGDISQQTFEQAKKAIEAGKNALQLQQGRLDAQKGIIDAAAGDTTAKINTATQATNNLVTASGKVAPEVAKIGPTAQSQIGSINAVAAAWRTVAKEARIAAAAGGGAGAPQAAFFGKQIHRQTGGFTRGQDRILTSTAPGEFVMNANSTRKFRSELTAMNANQTPQFRETGGAVTNVGDINVNINSSDTGAVQGRSIARDLKRELRTRTSSL